MSQKLYKAQGYVKDKLFNISISFKKSLEIKSRRHGNTDPMLQE